MNERKASEGRMCFGKQY